MPRSRPLAVAIHEAAYAVAADALGVTLRPVSLRRIGLRRAACDVIDFAATDDGSAEVCERMATVMLAGRAATRANGDRDDCEALDLLLAGFQRRYGIGALKNPSQLREFHFRFAALQNDAKALVARIADDQFLASNPRLVGGVRVGSSRMTAARTPKTPRKRPTTTPRLLANP
jgi:hypothetical protein